MKKFLLIILIMVILGCNLIKKNVPVFIEKIDLNLQTNEMAIVNLYFNKNKAYLLKTKDINILLIIDLVDKEKLISNLNDFNIKLDYLISYKDHQIDSNYKLQLKEQLEIGEIKIIENNDIQINYQNHNFCIVKSNIINNCNYVYLDNPSGDIEIINEPELILYQKLDEKFLEKTYDKWFDIYYVNPTYYTVLKLSDGTYNIINIPIKD